MATEKTFGFALVESGKNSTISKFDMCGSLIRI
jgi:hypothetical protein